MPVGERVLALLLVALACWCALVLLRRDRPTRVDLPVAVLLAAGSLRWLFESHAYEGPTVLALTHSSGLTAVDLGVVPDLCLAGCVLLRAFRARPGAHLRRLSARPPVGRPPRSALPPGRGRTRPPSRGPRP